MYGKNVIGHNVKYFRELKKISQEQLTARLNIQGIEIDQPMLSRIENCTRQLLDFEIIGIAKALKIGIEDLFKL
ncbi:helix-turn-helix domain-containing protein [Marinisporobacter balticus]|uniref:Helix-turn-helix protein n=1 Tax=Marinisporobacter balticus TaxID=2018667 RepID=A0A4R2L1F2_9FIRM|nr:helix-turn-helix transcriptional regulator [Marinisporobacter balticus]TCO79422.1 helix-turn-helix protein [Marinisporobacter balticus]